MKTNIVNNKESVSPHKLAVMVMIREYSLLNVKVMDSVGPQDAACVFTEAEKRSFMILLLKLLQSADIQLPQLVEMITKANIQTTFWKRIQEKLEEFHEEEDGLIKIMDYFQSLSSTLLTSTTNSSAPLISRTSLIGLFIRRMILSFDSLTFSQVLKLCTQYKEYYAQWKQSPRRGSLVSFDISVTDSSQDPFVSGTYSQRQAEFFVARQTHLLQHNESEAASPHDLQQRIHQLLTNNPNFAEAHYLSYMNQLRVGEYCSAVHSLYHYFDRHPLPPGKNKDSLDDNRAFRYAALNLAALHCRFGHRQEARAALLEAIRMAQETNDTACLQHALGWLHRLGEQNIAFTANMLDRSVSKAEKLSLWYLTSLNVQSLSKHNAMSTSQPSSVFDYLMKSDILNCQHSINDLMSLSYAQKSALWSMYGVRELSSICSQAQLQLNTAEGGIHQQTECEQLALCQIVSHLAHKGMYSEVREVLNILNTTSASFTNRWWLICEQEVEFDIAVHHGKWQEAQEAADNIAVFDQSEAEYRQAILMRYREQTPKAIEVLQKLLKSDGKQPEYIARVTLLLAELYCQTGNHTLALTYALNCLSLGQKHHLGYNVAITKLVLASIQYCLGLPNQALQLLEKCMVDVFSVASLFDQARAQFLYAKIQAATTSGESPDVRRKGLLNAVDLLNQSLEKFKVVGSLSHIKETVYYKAMLYNELGCTAERNKCSLEFRQLDDQVTVHSNFVF